MKKEISMKKAITFLTVVFVLFVLIRGAIADDMDSLQKLQPLTKDEQAMYDKAKNNPFELHDFIATREYMRIVMPLFEHKNSNFQCGQACPDISNNILYMYCSLPEQLILAKIMLEQDPLPVCSASKDKNISEDSRKWIQLDKMQKSGILYYDANSVKYLPDNKVQVSAKLTGNNGTTQLLLFSCAYPIDLKVDYGDLNSIQITNQINCTTKESLFISENFYGNKGDIMCQCKAASKAKRHKINIVDDESSTIDDKISTRIYQAICK
jgi:hypothetical protein